MTTDPRNLLLVGALALLPFLAIQGARQGASVDPQLSWPPPPTKFVSFAARISHASIPPGGTYTIYRVPDNQWFVLTDVVLRRFTGTEDAQWLHVRQLRDGIVTPRIGRGYVTSGWSADPPTGQGGYHSALGTLFEPGSEVVLFNDPLAPLTITEVRLEALDGYLVRAF